MPTVLPEFRTADIGCMAMKGVLLGNAEWMCEPPGGERLADHADARRVYAVLSQGIMPPGNTWPPAWMETFTSLRRYGVNP